MYFYTFIYLSANVTGSLPDYKEITFDLKLVATKIEEKRSKTGEVNSIANAFRLML